ncbi:MAG: hypothetical protein ACM31H_01080 [Nitrososphaerales archaeon]
MNNWNFEKLQDKLIILIHKSGLERIIDIFKYDEDIIRREFEYTLTDRDVIEALKLLNRIKHEN